MTIGMAGPTGKLVLESVGGAREDAFPAPNWICESAIPERDAALGLKRLGIDN
jgi:hypothetical protein